MALYDSEGFKISGFKAGTMIAKRFDECQNEIPYLSDILGSDWLPGNPPARRSDLRRLAIEMACKVYDQSAQHC